MLQQVRKRGISDLKNKVKRKKSIWKHKFFCLAYAGQKRVPTTEDEKDELFVAGLGEKDIEFERLDLTAEEFKDVLLQAFPQLCEGGGYQLCKCIPNSRKLEPLPHRVMASPLMLRQRSGVSRTYIVPIQKDLDLTPTDCADSSLVESCLICGLKVELSCLPEHIELCKSLKDSKPSNEKPDELPSEDSDDDNDFEKLPDWRAPTPSSNLREKPTVQSPSLAASNSNAQILTSSSDVLRLQGRVVDLTTDEELTEDTIIQTVVTDSIHEVQSSPEAPPYSPFTPPQVVQTLSSILKSLACSLLPDTLSITVRRDHLFQDAMREGQKTKFNVNKNIKVTFAGESAIDMGGPRREFFRLFAVETLDSSYFQGGGCKVFCSSVHGVQRGDYRTIGAYAAMSMVQGGPALPIFANAVLVYFSSGTVTRVQIEVDNLPLHLKSLFEQLSAGKKDHEICSIFAIEENASLLLETGYEKPLHTLTLQDIGDIRAAMTDYHCMIKVKAAMDQFLEGLEMGGVAGYLKTNPDLFRPLLQHIPQEIDTGGESNCTLTDVLVFFTGASAIPPLGFGKTPKLIFLETPSEKLPTTSTCDLHIRIPIAHGDNFNAFREWMELGILGNSGFGEV